MPEALASREFLALQPPPDPELKTFLERAIEKLPLPYWVSCVLLGTLISNQGLYLLLTAMTGDATRSFQIVYGAPLGLSPFAFAAFLVLNTGVNVYLFFMIRAVRRQPLLAEPAIVPLVPEGDVTFRRVLSRLSSPLPPLVLGLGLAAAFVPLSEAHLATAMGSLLLIPFTVALVLFYLVLGTAVWTCVSVLWGLYKFGQSPLRRKPASEEPGRGLRPLGTLSLNFSAVYFAGVGVAVLMTYVSGLTPASYLAFLAGGLRGRNPRRMGAWLRLVVDNLDAALKSPRLDALPHRATRPIRVQDMSVPLSVERAVAKRCVLAAVMTVAILLLIPAGFVAASGPNGSLKGFVTDNGTSAPIAGATVTIKATDLPWVVQATTDASGFYAVSLPNRHYAVSISSPSYYLGSVTADVGSGLTTWSNVTLTAAAPRSAHLQGYVTDSVSGAAVTTGRIVAAPPFWASGDVYTNASALNATGFYAMDLVPDTYVASTDGIQNYTPYTYSYLYLGAGQTQWLNFSLTPDPLVAWVNGTVVDASNYTLLAGASITATVDGLRFPPMTSNATGTFSLRVPTGDVTITADASGHAPGTTTVYVYGAGTFSTTLYLTPLSASVRGTVRNGLSGMPVPGALVVASPFWSSGYFDEATADASGSYRLNLTADDFDLRATAPGFTSWYSYAFLSTGETDWVNVTLWPLVATVQGYVVDGTTGAHLAGVYVNAYDPRAGYSAWAVADASGLFSVLLPPSPAIMLRVTGVPPYIGAAVYLNSRPFAITWANITLDRVAASVRVTVTDEPTGLPLASASVSASWGIGSGSGVTDASGVASVGVPGGMDLYVYVGAVGHFSWSGTMAAFTGTYDLAVQLNPALTANVTVQGYVRDAVTNATIAFATVQATGYDGSGPWDYTDGTGYYSFAMVPASQAIRVAAYGYTAATVTVAPAAGSTIWVNVSLARDTTLPVILSFTATPSTNLGPANPTTLRAAVNDTSFDRATLSFWMLRSTAGIVGTFLNLGALGSSRVSVAPTTPGNVSVSATWDTRTSVARLTDGIASDWWPATPSGYPFLIALSGYWDNTTLTAPTAGTAYFDARSGTLLYVYTSYGYITGQDQPGSTFQPYSLGMQVDLGASSIVGNSLVMGSVYQLGTLRLSVSPAVPGGAYAALLETWDAGGNHARSAVLLQAVADTTPPVARAGVDQTVDQGATVTLDGIASSDDTGIASYTWTFTDGTPQILYGATATHSFANPGVYLVTLTVQDAAGNVGTDTLTVTVRDTASPTVSINTPTAGANVSGSIIVAASASDNVGVVRVDFLVDGSAIGNATVAPFQISVDTRVLANGNHTIEAVAYDAAGNSASSNRTVSVSNAPGSGGGPPGFLGIDPLLLALLAAVCAAIGIGVALIAARRRRPRAPTAVPLAGMVPQAPPSEGTQQEGFESRNP